MQQAMIASGTLSWVKEAAQRHTDLSQHISDAKVKVFYGEEPKRLCTANDLHIELPLSGWSKNVEYGWQSLKFFLSYMLTSDTNTIDIQIVLHIQEAYAFKAGWIWRFSRSHRKWIKRWARFDGRSTLFTFLKGPWKSQKDKKSQNSKRTLGVSTLKLQTLGGECKLYGFIVEFAHGKTTTFCCSTASERDEWVAFLTSCLASSVTLDSRYDLHWQNLLGSGAYADVVAATDRITGDLVAVKMVTKTACKKYFDLMDKEVQIMSMVRGSPFLLGVREAFYSADQIFIVSDLLAGGDLKCRCAAHQGSGPPYAESEAKTVLKQVLYALDKLHSLGISHCDLKPENVMFRGADDTVKLIDFNSATFFCEPAEPGGTPEYMAPELLDSKLSAGVQGWDSALDMWAVGILLFWMLTGNTPFQAETFSEILHNVQYESPCWPGEEVLSIEAKNLIVSLLQREPNARPTAREVMSHNWMQQEKRLMPLISLIADSSTVPISLPSGQQEITEPIASAVLDTATIAAMESLTPTHLCVRVPRKESSIKYGFAASRGFSQSKRQLVIDTDNSDRGLTTADSALTLDSLADSPDSRDPMDSCMSVHRNLSFRTADGSVADALDSLGICTPTSRSATISEPR